MDKPIKKYRSGSVEGAIWLNAKDIDGTRVEFKTATLSRSWRDKDSGDWRSERINLRKTDIQKMLVVLQAVQNNLFLEEDQKIDKSKND